MLARFRDLTFVRKLRLVMVATAVLALVAAGLGYGASDYALFRRTVLSETRSLAEVLAANSVGALEFEDAVVAQETLDALSLRENIAAAALYTVRGERLAAYRRPGADAAFPDRPSPVDRYAFAWGHLVLEQPVRFQGKLLGSVYLNSDMRELYQRATWFAGTALLVLLGSTLLAAAVATRLQGLVSVPVLRLVAAVRRVSEDKDYGVRVEKTGADELGLLTDGFNEMIARIQKHDAESEAARRELARQAEALALSNAELDDFAYIASHDLKEPLRGLNSYSRFLLQDYGERLDAEGVRKLETLVRLTQRMETLIDTLLHYSRLGRSENAEGAVDLDELLHGVLDMLGPRLEEEGVEVRIPRPLPHVVCQGARVGEVFRNLIGNAIKYGEGPQRWIEVEWQCGAEPGPAAHVELRGDARPGDPVFCVRDNGIGIREKHLASVFRIFKRLHGRDRYGGGVGAGLSIVKKIVDGHRGRLWLESTPGEGTAFHFSVGELHVEKPGEDDPHRRG